MTPFTSVPIPVMRAAELDADRLVAWFAGRQPQPSGSYAAAEPVENLARYFLEEGAMEGVSGDVAFVQSVIETGWFRFQGSVPAWKNNFGGIGATGPGPDAAAFPDARTGIRAQIQHLRAYADPSAYACTVPPLHNPCVDPRFDLVTPKGRATNWNDLGNGNWAAASGYGASIVRLYEEARVFNGVR
ncbi:MAG: glucosaminidase domain-containing protein [Vicinamibacterales bacterium]